MVLLSVSARATGGEDEVEGPRPLGQSASAGRSPPAGRFRPGQFGGPNPPHAPLRLLDTKVLVRFFVDDDDDEESARQCLAAIAALSERAFMSARVRLGDARLLRLSVAEASRVFRALAGIEHLSIENRGVVITAMDAHEQGMDFADALHLARSAGRSVFVTFDQPLAKRPRGLALTPAIGLF